MLVCVALAVGVRLLIWVPYQCDLLEARLLARTQRTLQREQYLAARIARQTVDEVQPCLCATRESVNMYMIDAANERLLNRWGAAEHMYRQALEYDHRPEIYLNLGVVQFQQGHQREALQNLYLAGRFQRSLLYDGEIPPDVAAIVRQRVLAEEDRLRAGRVRR